MIQVHQLTFGPFAENTYILSDEDNNAIIIDPGMYHADENARFFEYMNSQNLKPFRMILTHAHLDHVFGVNWVNETYGLVPEVHQDDKFIYDNAATVAHQYGLKMDNLIAPLVGLQDGSEFEFGGEKISVFLAPGHSPGSVCFYVDSQKVLIAGDVIFQGSIGRTDLPGGSYDVLMNSIHSKVMTLSDEVTIYSGHGPITTVGQERIANPFINQ
ncbi:MAG: MBL fold metallo-hydrolase [Bacteroidia bacterium]